MFATTIHRISRNAVLACAIAATVSMAACRSKSEIPELAAQESEQADTAAVSPNARDACDLVTRGEMEELLGKPVEAPKNGEDGDKAKCVYAIPGSATAVQIEVRWDGGDAAWAGVLAGKKLLDNSSSGMGVGPVEEPIPNLGDDAFIQSVKMPKIALPANTGIDIANLGGGQGVLWMKKGADVVSITIANQDDVKEKAIAIAHKTLARL
jgi:hypothetical protein